jgi:hypothetical protein
MIFLKVSSLERSASEMRIEITGCCGVAAFSAMEVLSQWLHSIKQ